MKKAIAILMLALAGMTAMAQTSVWDGTRTIWTRGEGTESSPYLIESAQNLAFLAYMVNKGFETEGLCFRLTTDIDLNGSEDQQWVPIGMSDRWFNEDGCDRGNPGYDFSPHTTFRGHFDGGEHSISNLYLDNSERIYGSCSGLFGFVEGKGDGDDVEYAVVENVFVTNGYIKGDIGGGIAACASKARISRCWSGAIIERAGSGTNSGSGGIVGRSKGSLQVRNCYNKGEIAGYFAAGIVGNGKAEISECYNEGDISGTYAGGIFGFAMNGIVCIDNCYNTGTISADGTGVSGSVPGPAAGGIASFVFLVGSAGSIMTNCYNVGAVSSTEEAGCILAYGPNVTLENNYYISTCDAGGEGEALTEEYMQSQAFVDLLNAGNSNPVWAIDENNTNGGFPILANINLAVGEKLETLFSVYPNPAHGQFTVEGTGTVRITNMMGQLVGTREIDGRQTIALPRGMYFVTLNGQTAKVVVE